MSASGATPESFPAYRRRYLPAMSRAQIDALPGKSSAVVILPTGAVEQHGPHLPVGVDSILGQAWLGAALPHVSASTPVYVGPAITFGKSNEHVGFPGTIAISARSLHRLVKTAARQIHALGFRTLAILNTHGGNSAVLVATLREIQTELGLNAGMLSFAWKPPLPKQEATYGFHAGHWETALMLAVAPHLVHRERAVCEFPARIDDPGELRPEDAPATFSWISADISRSGVMGDATKANARDGAAWFAVAAQALAKQIVALTEKVARA
jgi:creatinine amidohydrolase